MRTTLIAAGVTLGLAVLLFLVIPSSKNHTPPKAPKSGPTRKHGPQSSKSDSQAEPGSVTKGPRRPLPKLADMKNSPVKPGLKGRDAVNDLLSRYRKDGQFEEHRFESDLAFHLFRNKKETELIVDMFLEQQDYQVAHAMARALAGTIVGQAKARQKMLDAILAPRNEVAEEAALYSLLSSHQHDDVQSALVEVYTSPERSERVRTSAAFVIREGLSAISEERRGVIRSTARSVLSSSYGQEGPKPTAPLMRVESIALLGGHLDIPDGDVQIIFQAVKEANDRDELEVALAMLRRHQVPANKVVPVLEQRVSQAQGDNKGMLQDVLRRTRALYTPTKAAPSRKSSAGQ